MSEDLGQAILELDTDNAPLVRGLADGERRTAQAVAVMQRMIDQLGAAWAKQAAIARAAADSEVAAAERVTAALLREAAAAKLAGDQQAAAALKARAAAAASGGQLPAVSGGRDVIVVPAGAQGPAGPSGHSSAPLGVWGVRGPAHPGSLTNPIVTVLEAGKYAPMGSMAAAVGDSNIAGMQGHDSPVAAALDVQALTASVSDLARASSSASRLAQAGAQGMVTPSIPDQPAGAPTTVVEDPEGAALLARALQTLGQIEQGVNGHPYITGNAAPMSRPYRTVIAEGEGPGRVIVAGPSGSDKTVVSGAPGESTVRIDGGQYAGLISAIVESGGGGPAVGIGGSGGSGGGGLGTAAAAAGGAAAGGGDKRSILARLGWGAGMFGMAGAGSTLALAGLDPMHVVLTALGLAGSAAGAGIGGGFLGAGALGITAVGAGSDAAVMKTTLANVKNVTTALNNLQQAQAVYGKGSTQAAVAQAQLNFQVSQLPPAAATQIVALAKARAAFQDYWQTASGPAQAKAAGIGQQALGVGNTFVPLVAGAASQNLTIISSGLKPLFAWLKGPDGIGIFHNLEYEFAKNLPFAMHAFGQGLELLLRIVNIASTHTGGLTHWLDRLFSRLNSMDNAQLGIVVTRYINDFHLWGTFVKLLGADIYQLFHADVGTGNSIIASLNGMLLKLHQYETSARGQAQLQNIFQVHKAEILALLALLPPLVRGFGSLYMALAPPLVNAMTTILDAIRPVLDALSAIAGSSHLASLAVGAMLLAWKGGALASLVPVVGGLRGVAGAERGAAAANLDTAATARLMAISAASAKGATAAEAAVAGETAAAAAGGAGGKGLLSKLTGLGGKAGAGIESGGLAAGGALEKIGLAGAGAGVVSTAGAIAPVVAAVIPIVLAAGGSVLAMRLLTGALGISANATTTVGPHTPAGSSHLTQGGFRSNLPGFFGSAEQSVVNAGLNLFGVSTSSTLKIKEVGNFAGYSAAQLRSLIAELKQAGAVKVNGIGESAKAVLGLAQAALKSRETWNRAFNQAWADVNRFYRNTSRGLGSLKDDFQSNMREIASSMGTNSTTGRKLVAENVDKMVSAVTRGMLSGKISVTHGMAAINDALRTGMRDGAMSWAQAWTARFATVNQLYAAGKVSTEQYMTAVHRIQTDGDARILQNAKSSAAAQIQTLQHQRDQGIITSQQLRDQTHQVHVTMASQARLDMGVFAAAIISAFSSAANKGGRGLGALITTVNNALHLLKQPKLSALQIAAAPAIAAASHIFAGGGLVQIGRPGEPGRDTVPLNVGGTPITVAPGEVVAVLNRHQLPIVNGRLADMGGLAGLYSSVTRPNYMAGGGFVPGFAGGGTVPYGQLEGLWDRAGGPPNMAALMAAIAEAESGGNPSAANSSGASGLWQILGVPFPGNVFDPLTNARMAVSKFRSQGLGAWVGYTSGAYRQFLQGGIPPGGLGALGGLGGIGSIPDPKVSGGGTIGDIVRAGLDLATKAANAFLQKMMPAGGAGGGMGPGTIMATGGKPADIERAMMAAAAQIMGLPYVWGGGHGSFSASGYDCSGAVSYLLHAAGLLSSPETTAGLASYGLPGPGKYITIGDLTGGAGGGHTMLSFFGKFLESGGPSGQGVHWDPTWSQSFPIMRHPAGLAAGGLVGDFGGMSPTALLAGAPHLAADPTFRAYAALKNRGGVTVDSKTHKPIPKNLLDRSKKGKKAGTPKGKAVGGQLPTLDAFNLGSDITGINHALKAILGIDGLSVAGAAGSSDVQNLTDQITYNEGLWGLKTLNYSSAPSDFVISTDPSTGASIAPYVNEGALQDAISELMQILGWQGKIVADLQTALAISNQLIPAIKAAIARRQAEVEAIKKRIRENLRTIGALKKHMTAKGVSKAAKRSLGKQISALENENVKLGGSRTTIGTGGDLGPLGSQLTGLRTDLAAVEQWPATIAGGTGIGGNLGPAMIAYDTTRQQLEQLKPGVATALSVAQNQGAGAAANTNSTLAGLLQQLVATQGQELAVSQAQYGVLSSLPPFGGSFLTGGMVPGPVGAARTVIAHGGEVINPAGAGGDTHVHIKYAKGMEWLARFVDCRVENNDRKTALRAGRGLPGRGGGNIR